MGELSPGDRVTIVTTEKWCALEMYGITGTVLDGPDRWDSYGVMLDEEFDSERLPLAFSRGELDKMETVEVG
ncbi:hypothetical protein [Streptomyces sp. MP131-18]|uniref:hypothetical protein n=1 Tax=Streptomyces sp. MP131-18 TaxID=1857892 RepID=UPI0009D1516C|nr:hypothetical protein [Streptomyces sp. MP131-18]ONK10348.1 hypothetical protein STBA_10700 [Streptomyces sp. MP131-18]